MNKVHNLLNKINNLEVNKWDNSVPVVQHGINIYRDVSLKLFIVGRQKTKELSKDWQSSIHINIDIIYNQGVNHGGETTLMHYQSVIWYKRLDLRTYKSRLVYFINHELEGIVNNQISIFNKQHENKIKTLALFENLV